MLNDILMKMDNISAVLTSFIGRFFSPIRALFPTPFPYFNLYLVSTVLNFLWCFYLNIRQLLRLKRPGVPKVCEKLMTEDEYKSAQAYNIDKLTFSMFTDVVYLFVEIALVMAFPNFWTLAGRVLGLQGYLSGEIWHSLLFMYLQNVVLVPLQTVFSVYKDFVIEEKHGFNKKTCGLFVKDLIKVQLLILAIGCPIGYFFLRLLQFERIVLYASTFYICISFVLISLFPHVIWPLFNTFVKIEREGVIEKVEALCNEVKYPLKKLYQMDGSKRSGHANAMLFGLWKNKQIVFYDTIIEMLDIEEIIAVLAHELGHWYHSHTLRGFFVSQLQFTGIMAGFNVVFHDQLMYQAFGFETQIAAVGFILYMKLLTPLDAFITYLSNAMVRSWEYQADRYAVKLGRGEKLATGLEKLSKEEKSNLDPDPMYANYHYSHPPIVIRLKEIRRQLTLVEGDGKKEN